MPAPNPTARSPPPAAGTSMPPSPPSPSSSSVHQLGSRQATRTRTRTRRNMSASVSSAHRTPRYTNDEHPLSAHNLDKHGYHSFRCLAVPFHVKKRYTFVRELGIGAYGCVALCRDHTLDCNVAIKKVTRIFEKDVLARRALREVAVLRHIGMCDNVTGLLDFDTTFIEFSEIYLVLSASEADLSQIIRSGQTLSDAHLQYFMAQLLRGVRYMHAANIIHRDLKPGNLLVNADCALRICDFGLARAFANSHDQPCQSHPDGDQIPSPSLGTTSSSSNDRFNVGNTGDQQPHQQTPTSTSPSSDLHHQLSRLDVKGKNTRLTFPGGPLTDYVATRWYRAPEVMLCFREGYGPEMDMWSVGCILAELIGGKPIFAGKDYVDQIARINNVLGRPSDSVMDKIGSERAKTYIKSLPDMPSVPFHHLYPHASPEALDLLSHLLTWDPEERFSAEQTLKHPWLKAYHESNIRWSPPPPFDRFLQVEFIRSLRQFKAGMQGEADEMRLELEAMEKEEAEAAFLDSSQQQQSVVPQHENIRSETDGSDSHFEPETATGHQGKAAREDGQQTQFDQQQQLQESENQELKSISKGKETIHLDAQQPAQECSASSCSASMHSCNLRASTASSDSSVHTPSSTATSADEADHPPSPHAFDNCRLNTVNRKTELDEGKALRQSPSFFRPRHEEEGRHISGLLHDRFRFEPQALMQVPVELYQNDDVFMPEDCLRVAQGLVEHQLAAFYPTDAKAIPILPHHETKPEMAPFPTFLSFSSKKDLMTEGSKVVEGPKTVGASKTMDAPSDSNPNHQRQAGGQQNVSNGGLGSRAGLGAASNRASTPSLGQGLLDNSAVIPTTSSSGAVSSYSSLRQSKQLIVIHDGLMQSSVGLMREIIHRNTSKGLYTLLVTQLYAPHLFCDGMDLSQVIVVDVSSRCPGYDEGDTHRTHTELIERIVTELEKLGQQARVTIVIDSLDSTTETDQDGIGASLSLVRTIVSKMSLQSRLLVGVQTDQPSRSSLLISALHTPFTWSFGQEPGAVAATGTVLTARLHSPAVLRLIHRTYSLIPPSTSAAIGQAIATEATLANVVDDGEDLAAVASQSEASSETDVRFWDILRNVANRGALGIPQYESGGGAMGWWIQASNTASEVESMMKGTSRAASTSRRPASSHSTQSSYKICLDDLVNGHADSNGWGFLELRYQARSGKVYEELVGCMSDSGRLRLCPLDMVDRRSQNAPPAAPLPDAAAAKAEKPTSAAATASSPGGGDVHASMVSKLTFNLSETDSQRARREEVPLPYTYHQNHTGPPVGGAMRGSTGNSTIFFEPEAGDDEDDEDPDDDLDL